MKEIDLEDLLKLREGFPKPTDICQWIRENISKNKLAEAKKFLEGYDRYFDNIMIEYCYRSIKNSIKIRYAYDDTMNFIAWFNYLLSPEQKQFDDSATVESNLIKLVDKDSFLNNFYGQVKESITLVKKKGESYFIFDKVALTWLGSCVMFYYMLKSVVDIVEKALTDDNYGLEGNLSWEEAIASYVLFQLKPIIVKN
jgi:hypothetical protein